MPYSTVYIGIQANFERLKYGTVILLLEADL